MRRRLGPASIAVAAALLAACSGAPTDPIDPPAVSTTVPVEPAGELQSFELPDAGTPRRYDVYAPPTAEAGGPRPAVVVMPGTNIALESLRSTTGFDLVADTEGFLVVYVDAGVDGFDGRLCCGGTDRDVDFVRSVLAAVDAQWPIDPDRVYATGFSAGAAMSYKLAVRAPEVFAAVAPVSGGFYPDPRADAPEAIVPAEAPSLLAVTGSADQDYADILAGVDLWRLGAGCAPETRTAVEATVGVERSVAECNGGSAVEVYTVADMGHSWPGGAGDTGFGDRASGLVATQVIWEFFATHSRR